MKFQLKITSVVMVHLKVDLVHQAQVLATADYKKYKLTMKKGLFILLILTIIFDGLFLSVFPDPINSCKEVKKTSVIIFCM